MLRLHLLVTSGQNPAGVIEPVIGGGHVLEIAGNTVRLAQLSRRGDYPRELREDAQEIVLTVIVEQGRIELRGPPIDAEISGVAKH